jgi:hypothetical protein
LRIGKQHDYEHAQERHQKNQRKPVVLKVKIEVIVVVVVLVASATRLPVIIILHYSSSSLHTKDNRGRVASHAPRRPGTTIPHHEAAAAPECHFDARAALNDSCTVPAIAGHVLPTGHLTQAPGPTVPSYRVTRSKLSKNRRKRDRGARDAGTVAGGSIEITGGNNPKRIAHQGYRPPRGHWPKITSLAHGDNISGQAYLIAGDETQQIISRNTHPGCGTGGAVESPKYLTYKTTINPRG